MCGVPVHAAEGYLNRLIRKGFKVAVCEQVEDPAEAKKRGAKSVVRRDVVRVVTPGTLTEDGLLDARRHNYLVRPRRRRGNARPRLGRHLHRRVPLPGDRAQGAAAPRWRASTRPRSWCPTACCCRATSTSCSRNWKSALSPLPNARFDSENARLRLQNFHKVAALDGFGAFTRAELAAAGALLDYVELTQQGKMPRLVAARAHRRRRDPGDRRRHPAQPRAQPHLQRRAAGQPARHHRPHRDRRRRAPARRMAGGAPDRHRRDRRAPGRGRASAQRDAPARGSARAPQARRRTWSARCRACRWTAAARATSPPSATACWPRPASRRCSPSARFGSPPPLLQQALTDLGHHAALIDRLTRALGREPAAAGARRRLHRAGLPARPRPVAHAARRIRAS